MPSDRPLSPSRSVCDCGYAFTRKVNQWPLRCVCGRIYYHGQIAIIPRRRRAAEKLEAGGRCGVLVDRQQPGYLMHKRGIMRPSTVCPLGKWSESQSSQERLSQCHDCDRFLPAQYCASGAAKVGFLAVAYMGIGGTETWHQTLVPRIRNCAGFVSLNASLSLGDFGKLGVPTGVGIQAAIDLAKSVDVLVVWGVGDVLGQIMEKAGKRRPRVISVSHCDARSQWTIDTMSQQSQWTDYCVYLCPSGIETIPVRLRPRSTQIPNGPDPARIVARESNVETRRWLGVPGDATLCLLFSRLSPEKRIDRLMRAVERLGDGYHLRIAGTAAGWSTSYAKHLEDLQTPRVRIIAPVDTPGDLLASADAVLSASEFEGYGLSSAEAMLAGVPVISTRVGLLEYDDTLAAIVPHSADDGGWASAIAADFASGDSQRARALRAQQVIATQHSVELFASRWEALINHIRESKSAFFASNSP